MNESPFALAWQSLVEYLHQPHAWVAVVTPLLLSVLYAVYYSRHHRESGALTMVWLATLPYTYMFAQWHVEDGLRMLYVINFFAIACFILVWRGWRIDPGLAFGYVFLQTLIVDLTKGYILAQDQRTPLQFFFHGVGGAGWMDGLVLMPTLTFLAVAYAVRRQKSARKAMRQLDTHPVTVMGPPPA